MPAVRSVVHPHTATPPLAIPMRHDRKRSLVRLSMPSDCPWYEGYTRNPLGVEPTGPVHPARTEFMAYRPLEPRRA
jgi:hypothetical protein